MQKTLENHQTSHPKSMQKPSKNHQKIDAEKHVKIEICPGPFPEQPGAS